jgi:hypothetical protein
LREDETAVWNHNPGEISRTYKEILVVDKKPARKLPA